MDSLGRGMCPVFPCLNISHFFLITLFRGENHSLKLCFLESERAISKWIWNILQIFYLGRWHAFKSTSRGARAISDSIGDCWNCQGWGFIQQRFPVQDCTILWLSAEGYFGFYGVFQVAELYHFLSADCIDFGKDVCWQHHSGKTNLYWFNQHI